MERVTESGGKWFGGRQIGFSSVFLSFLYLLCSSLCHYGDRRALRVFYVIGEARLLLGLPALVTRRKIVETGGGMLWSGGGV